MNTTGNTILVTGGGSGIGRGLAEAFHALGNKVIIAGRRQEVLDEVTDANPGMAAVQLDIDKPDAIEAFAKELISYQPQLNVVINNAGITRREKLTEAPSTLQDSEAVIATNVLGPIRLTSALMPHLLKQPRATIINVSSGLAFVPFVLGPTYSASKAFLHSYTQSLRWHLRETPISVLEIIPPYVQTEFGGPQQTVDPRAMPLKDFIAETMSIIQNDPKAVEICTERVKPMRMAEANGTWNDTFDFLCKMF